MALTIGELVGYVRIDDSGARRGIAATERQMRGLQRDTDGRLRDLRGRFVSESQAMGQALGDGIESGSRRGRFSLRGLASAVGGLGSAAAGALPAMGGAGAAVKGIGVAAAVTALPAIGALVPMLAGAGLAAGVAKLAFSGVGEAVALASEDSAEYRKQLAAMPPEQRAFTKAVVAAKKEFSGLGDEVKEIVLPSFTKALRSAKPVIGVVKDGVRGMAGVFADLGDEFGELFGSDRFQSALRRNLTLGTGFIRDIGLSLDDFTQGLLDFGAASKPTLDAFGRGFSNLLSQGLPGFFRGLQGGIRGAAQMFDGLFFAINKVLPAFGEFAGAAADALGPALREIFRETGTTGAGVFRALARAVGFLKPLFREISGAMSVFHVALRVAGSIAQDVGRVLIESLWPSFREAKNAEGPLQRLAGWLRENRVQVMEFGRQASNAILTFIDAALAAAPVVIQAFRLMTTGILTALDAIISGAADSFGWIPGIGDKLEDANDKFDRFKNGFISGLHQAEDRTRTFANQVRPRLEQNRLRMNIQNWQSQIDTARRQMKTVPPEKRSELRARIDDLQRKVGQAKGELASIRDRTVFVNMVARRMGNWLNNVTPFAEGGPVRRATGGPISGPGTTTSDDIPALLSDDEHVWTAKEVDGAGGHAAVERLRAMARRGMVRFARGGAVGYASGGRVRGQIPGDLRRFTKSLDDGARAIRGSTKELARDLRKLGAQRLGRRVSRVADRLVDLSKRQERVSRRLEGAQDKLKDLVQSRSQLRGEVRGGIMSGASVTAQDTDGGPVTVGSILSQLGNDAQAAQAFADNLRKLRRRGVNKNIVADIAKAGVEGGGAQAAALAGANAAQIRQLNRQQGLLRAAAKQAGDTAGYAMYGAGINAARGLVRGLQRQEKSIERQMMRIAKGMSKAIRRALGIKSPSQVMAGIGTYIPAGLVEGIASGQGAVDSAMSSLVSVPAVPGVASPGGADWRQARGSSGGGQVATLRIELAGPADMRRLIRRIVQVDGRGSVQVAFGTK